MPSRLEALPPELLLYTLSFLPTSTLAVLSQTNSRLQHLSKTAQTTLHLAIFPKRLHAVLSFLDSPEAIQNDPDHFVKIALPLPSSKSSRPNSSPRSSASPKPSRLSSSRPSLSYQRRRCHSPEESNLPPPVRRETLINLSCNRAIEITTPLSPNLRTLSLLLWSPTDSLLTRLATAFPSLRSLSLRFSHPMHRDPALPAFYFDSAPKPSPAWNALAGIGDTHHAALTLRGLEKLSIEHAGLTSAQLRGVVASNPGLRELHLKCVRGVDAEFLTWLGRRAQTRQTRLHVLCLTDCQNLELPAPASDQLDEDEDEEEVGGCEWISQLKSAGLTRLLLEGCVGVEAGVLRRIEREGFRHDRNGKLGGPARERAAVAAAAGTGVRPLEVDPECL